VKTTLRREETHRATTKWRWRSRTDWHGAVQYSKAAKDSPSVHVIHYYLRTTTILEGIEAALLICNGHRMCGVCERRLRQGVATDANAEVPRHYYCNKGLS
jgi:hypothetical protein